MGTMGLLSGRSRHGTRKARPYSSSHSTRPKKRRDDAVEEEVEEVPKPTVDELRERRATYYSLPYRERQKISSSATSKTRPKSSAVSSSRSASSSDRRHRSRSHKRSSREKDKAEKTIDEGRRRTEDYVYGPRPSVGLETIAEEPLDSRSGRLRSEKRRSRPSSPPRRRSAPTVVDAEITPDDSISQVGERDAAGSRRSGVNVRPSLRRSNTTSAKLDRVPETSAETKSVSTARRSSRHTPSLLGSTVRRHSTTSVPEKPRLVDCLTCGSDDIPIAKSAKLNCGHRMCQDCLKRIFEMSVKDPAHMPPKCCGEEHIPLRHVEKLFDVKFKVLWNRKYQEYNTKNRIYCPTLKCGEWIKPSHIHTSQGRKYALCPRCKTKVCTLCNGKMHRSTECPKDPEIAKLVEQAKEKGWQRCYSCSSFVEKKEGCNHMTCRCLAEFCIVCGAKWKTCDCPWFNYNNLPNPDRLNEMRVPEPIQMIYRQVFRDAVNPFVPPPPPPPGPAAAQPRNPPPGPLPEVTYQQEMDQRRRQERLDADLARRLQLQTLMDPDDGGMPRRRGDIDIIGLGNAARNFMNDDFVQNAANVVMSAFGDANLGRRGERSSGRRRRPRPANQNDGDLGLAPNFLGDESVLGNDARVRS